MNFNKCDFEKNVVDSLNALFYNGRRPHAVLIDGGDEETRRSLSLYVAKAFVCSDLNDAPCDACRSCNKASEGIHPDIITVSRPEDKKFFTKESVKKITEEAYLTPNESETKVFLISELQFMTEESQNVLLKILEEPPEYSAFILTAKSYNAVIGTVLSRVTRLRLGKDDVGLMYDEKTVSVTKDIMAAVSSAYEFDIIAAASPLDGNKQLTASVLSMLSLALRDAIVQKNGGKAELSSLSAETFTVGMQYKADRLLKMYSNINSLIRSIDNNPNYNLLSALLCASFKEVENI